MYSQCDLRQLFLGEVQRVVEGPDPVLAGVFPLRQVRSQDAVIHHVDEGSNTVPAFIIEPDLRTVKHEPSNVQKQEGFSVCFLSHFSLTLTLFLVSKPLIKLDKLSRNRSAAAP